MPNRKNKRKSTPAVEQRDDNHIVANLAQDMTGGRSSQVAGGLTREVLRFSAHCCWNVVKFPFLCVGSLIGKRSVKLQAHKMSPLQRARLNHSRDKLIEEERRAARLYSRLCEIQAELNEQDLIVKQRQSEMEDVEQEIAVEMDSEPSVSRTVTTFTVGAACGALAAGYPHVVAGVAKDLAVAALTRIAG